MRAVILLVSFLSFVSIDAKVHVIKSVSQLLAKLSAAPYSVAVFYTKEKNALHNLVLKQNIDDMQIMMRSMSDDPLYKNADLQFFLVDISRTSILPVLRLFKIRRLPTTLIFIGRQVVGEPLVGFAERAQLVQAINEQLEQPMADRMKQKEYQLKREAEIAKIRSYDQAYMWGSYWAPYWNYGYAPYWGFGWRPYNWWVY